MFGAKIIKPANGKKAAKLSDESEFVRRVLSAHVAQADLMRTSLMMRWHPGEPTIIQSPRSGSGR